MRNITGYDYNHWADAIAMPHHEDVVFDGACLFAHRPDWHLVCRTDGVVTARCSCWVRKAASMPGEQPGIIGHFAATDSNSSRLVLAAALDWLHGNCCSLAIGPMDGNTWHRYRWVTEYGEEAPFLMEPVNPREYPRWWEEAGFKPLAQYQSALSTDFQGDDPRLNRVRQRLADTGVLIRAFEPATFEDELRLLHRVSLAGFTRNFLYTPLTERDFFALYLPYRDKIRPEFVLLAMQGQTCVGFIFAIPDYLRLAAGHPLDTIILKTAVILPSRTYAGLGTLLAESVHHAAAAAGMTRAIHALSHVGNSVINLSARYASVFRRYTLYAQRLSP